MDDNVEEKDSSNNSSSNEETGETKELSSFTIGDQPLSPVELTNIYEFSSKVTADIIHSAATKALNTNETINDVRVETIKQCHTVSQYSYLLKNGLDEDQTDEQNFDKTNTEDIFDKVSDCSCSDCEADPETRTPARGRTYCIKCGHYVIHKKVSVTSMDSNSSADSDISTSSSEQRSPDGLAEPKTPKVTVIIDGHNDVDIDNKSDDVTPTPSPNPSPATTPTRESMTDAGLTSITEVSDSCEVNGNVDLANNNNNFKFSVENKSSVTYTRKDSGNTKQNSLVSTLMSTSNNGIKSTTTVIQTKSFSTSTTSVSQSSSMDSMAYVERKDSETSMSSEVFPRKESIASTNSVDSNCDEDEERDVVGPFKYKRDLEKTFGSSLRLNMIPKKVSTGHDINF